MQYYLAPMEGITTYIYRNAYAKYFGHIDKYFTPFIASKKMNTREVRDILPENNEGIEVVPQILTNRVDDFLAIAEKIASYGYQTVNLNLGCPSGTVTAKKRGAGFLSVPDELDAFLYEIYEKCPLRISIKTRLGIYDLEEWDDLLDIYAKYPIDELIIHTRLQKEFYAGKTHPEAYALAQSRLCNNAQANLPSAADQPHDAAAYASAACDTLRQTADTASTARNSLPASVCDIPLRLCYNGDIISAESLHTLTLELASLRQNAPDAIMLGRGIIRNPGLAGQLKAQEQTAGQLKAQERTAGQLKAQERTAGQLNIQANNSIHPEPCKICKSTKQMWLDFHNEILEEYRKIMSGDLPVLFKMKDLWTYMSQSFTDSENYLKKIRKAERITDYMIAVNTLFREQEIISE